MPASGQPKSLTVLPDQIELWVAKRETIRRIRDAVYAWTFVEPPDWEVGFAWDWKSEVLVSPPRGWFWLTCPLPIGDRLRYRGRITVAGALAWALSMEWHDRMRALAVAGESLLDATVEADRRLSRSADAVAWATALDPVHGLGGCWPTAPVAAWAIGADIGNADFIDDRRMQAVLVGADIIAFAGPEPLRRWLAEPEKHIEEMLMVLAWATEERRKATAVA